jgi:signal transduction histidine kinase
MTSEARHGSPARHRLMRALAHILVLAGLAGLVSAAYLAVILAFGRLPRGGEWTLLGLSAAAAALCALVWVPFRERLLGLADRVAGDERAAPDDALRTFGRRLTRAQPFEELLLELVETLRRTLALEAAEVWTGAGGVLERAASDPHRGVANVILTPAEEAVVVKVGVAGQTWASVWLADLVAGREHAELRVAPITSAGELLGLILVGRPPGGEPFQEVDERVLADLARQLGLALRNVRLDSALEASLDELRLQAQELRACVVTAADAERRRIERDLHDGAQQHLVGLVVNLRLARELAEADPAEAKALLESLGHDAKQAFEELRELAHGIYPPLLLDRGLDEAIRAVASRAAVGARVEASAIGRYAPQVEATIYFCCVEALQNAAKHAGPGARATVHIVEEEGVLRFEVADDGAGFDSRSARPGAGLTSMGDRLGALGGRLMVSAQPDHGTRVSGTIPLVP